MLLFQSLAKACPVEINHTLSQVYSPEMQCSNTEVSSINMHPLYCGFLVLTPWNELTGYVLLSLFRSEEIVAPKTVWLCMYINRRVYLRQSNERMSFASWGDSAAFISVRDLCSLSEIPSALLVAFPFTILQKKKNK